MGDGLSDAMNLDLNLGPVPEPEPGSGLIPSEAVNLDVLIEGPVRRIREAVRLRARQQRWRWRQLVIPPETRDISIELNQLMADSGNGGSLQAGEGSVAAEERVVEVPKACENNNGFLEEDASDNKVDTDKGCGNDGSFFHCNICLDLAREPVVTCCGHLFCWPCLYRWLHLYSDAKECPVCKGEVSIKNVTPIYGRGSSVHEPEEDSSLQIPVRPHARRVESWRQTIQRTALTFPVEEMIRDLISQPETTERTNALLARILSSRSMRREQNSTVSPDESVDLNVPDAWESRRMHSMLLRRSQQLQRAATLSSLALNSTERHAESILRRQLNGRNQEPGGAVVDDRDSFSSVAAVMNSESQTMDSTMEIDSMVSLSTSSSRRRNDAFRVSDVDSGDSRAPRRRRLH